MELSIEQVKAHFKQWNREKDIIEFDVSSVTVGQAAEALQVEPEKIAKTIAFRGPAIGLSCEELYTYGNAEKWVDVGKGWNEENADFA
jgi:hypothetical protein